jgi:hypothetical protein
MKTLLITLIIVSISSISLSSSDVIFTSIDGKSYLYNKANNKYEAVKELQTQLVNLDGVRYNYNTTNQKWEKAHLKMNLNYFCENNNLFDQLLNSLNLRKENLINIESFGIKAGKSYYYELTQLNQSGIIVLKNE